MLALSGLVYVAILQAGRIVNRDLVDKTDVGCRLCSDCARGLSLPQKQHTPLVYMPRYYYIGNQNFEASFCLYTF